MARTKQNARKATGGIAPRKEESRKRQKTEKKAPKSRLYALVDSDEKQTVTQLVVDDEVECDFIRQRTLPEHTQTSLVHAVNNTVGLHLLSPADMFTARAELVEAAGEMALDLYLGTDEQGTGDWPVEVAQHALYKKLTTDNLTYKCVNFGQRPDGTLPKGNPHGVLSHGYTQDVLIELQFPTEDVNTTAAAVDPSSTTATAEDTGTIVPTVPNVDPIVGYDWKSLPVGKNGERRHFVAVRNRLVFDSAVPRVDGQRATGIDLRTYSYFVYTKKVYLLKIGGLSYDAGSKEQVGLVQKRGHEGGEVEEGGENEEEDREGESDDEEVRQRELTQKVEVAESK